MKMNRIVWGLLVAAALVSQAAYADDAVTLARKQKVGDTIHFKTTINANVNGQDVVATQKTKYTVKEVKDDKVTLEAASEGMTVNIGGMDQEQPAAPPMTEVRDKSGKLIDFKMDESGQSIFSPDVARLVAAISEIVFSDKAVKAGDDWETTLDSPIKDAKNKKVVVKTTYVGNEKVDGKDLWKVKQTAAPETDADGNKLTYEYTAWLDPDNGQTVKAEGSVKDLPTNFGPLSWTMKMVQVKGDEKEEKAAK